MSTMSTVSSVHHVNVHEWERLRGLGGKKKMKLKKKKKEWERYRGLEGEEKDGTEEERIFGTGGRRRRRRELKVF